MTLPFSRSPLAQAWVGASLLLGSLSSLAAGFQLNETSGSGLGLAFAGGAASAEDAGTLWSNPAGLSRLSTRQVVNVVHLITPSIKFSNDASAAASQQALGGNGGDAGGLNVVPNLYLAMPVNSSLVLGLGINAPWGLVTEYDPAWAGRFLASKSAIQTLNINPALSWKPAANLSLGLGLNVQRMLAEFTNDVNYSAALLSAAAANGIAPGTATFNGIAAATPGLVSAARIKGSDNATGWNAGLLWDINPQQRVGLHYRSAMRYQLQGSVHFDNPSPVVAGALGPTVTALSNGLNGTALVDSGVSAEVKLPPIANLSYFGAQGPNWDLMADLQWTGWSTVQTLRFVRSNGSTLQSTPENFKDSYKLAIGANYRPGGNWLWRMGVAFDQTPVRDGYRTPRLPDGDRTWLTGGAQFRANANWRFDLGAAYIWAKRVVIDDTGSDPTGRASGRLNGHYNNHTTILSGQATWSF